MTWAAKRRYTGFSGSARGNAYGKLSVRLVEDAVKLGSVLDV